MAALDSTGDRIGRYKLREKIGEGGCGTVYIAEQEEPVRRRVALKVIKLGMDTREVIARFEAERQALALMDHPNIAKVLDAGATETGRPYFVMELVKGIRITDYCDQNNLTTQSRLDLFTQVCQAIQHAHQKGIIHRDIKPSNILVSSHDGVRVPKVIDFGIAKATQGRLTDLTIYSELNQFIGTPAYMSPEQAEMSGLDIDTRTDIYALGVLLYELLTGKTPFSGRELLASGLEAMRRTIREKEPARPSTRLSTMLDEDRMAIARHRQTDSRKLTSLLRGDLDWIVMKALEKDRTRRYDTANGFALDIKRFLADEPVSAAAPSATYRFGKFARRNKTALGVATAMAAILFAATVTSTWQAVRAARERDAKDKARQEAEAISTFLTDVFQSPEPAREGRTITVAETLNRAAKKLDAELASQPDRRAKLQHTLGVTYQALGLPYDAIPLLEKCRDYYAATLGPDDFQLRAVKTYLAHSYSITGRQQEALKLREEILASNRKLNDASNPNHPETLKALHNLASSYHDAGRREEALKMRERVLKFSREVNGPENPFTLAAIESLALSYADFGRRKEAVQLEEEALPLLTKVKGPEHPDTLGLMQNLASSYYDSGRREEALKMYEDVLKLRRKVNGPEHSDTLSAMNHLGLAFYQLGRLEAARQLQEEIVAINSRIHGPSHVETVGSMNNLAFTYQDLGGGRETDVLNMREKVLEVWRKSKGPEHPHTLMAMQNLALTYAQAGRIAEAIPLAEQTFALRVNVMGAEHPDTLKMMSDMGALYFEGGRKAEALKLNEDVLVLHRKLDGPEHPATLHAFQNLAVSYQDAGRVDEAIKLEEQSMALFIKVLGPEHPKTIHQMHNLGISYSKSGRRDDAIQLREKLLPLLRKVMGPDHPETLYEMGALARSFTNAGRWDEAIQLRTDILSGRRKTLGPDHSDTIRALETLANFYAGAGRPDEALKLRGALTKSTASRVAPKGQTDAGKTSPSTLPTASSDSEIYSRADTLYRQGVYSHAEPLYRQLLQNQLKAFPATNDSALGIAASLARDLSDWAWTERSSNRNALAHRHALEAESLLRDCLEARLRGSSSNSWRTIDVKSRYAFARLTAAVTDGTLSADNRAAQFSEAERLLLQSIGALQSAPNLNATYKRDSLERVVRLYQAWDKPAQLAEWKQKLEAVDKAKAE